LLFIAPEFVSEFASKFNALPEIKFPVLFAEFATKKVKLFFAEISEELIN
jgi:hypothetical protein